MHIHGGQGTLNRGPGIEGACGQVWAKCVLESPLATVTSCRHLAVEQTAQKELGADTGDDSDPRSIRTWTVRGLYLTQFISVLIHVPRRWVLFSLYSFQGAK